MEWSPSITTRNQPLVSCIIQIFELRQAMEAEQLNTLIHLQQDLETRIAALRGYL